MKICFHSVSPQNKPSVTLCEPSRRGHSRLSCAWHPAPLLPGAQGQGRGLRGRGSPRRGLPAGAAGSSHAPQLQG